VTLGESVNSIQILGIAVVLTATILVQIPERATTPH
jgi:drug/metabolite transporter (DMT)-like permease